MDLAHSIERGELVRITCLQEGEKRHTVCDLSGLTLKWQVTSDEMVIVASLEDGRISVKGRYRGEPVQEVFPKKALPWFQLLSFSLGPFVRSDDALVKFRMLRPDNLSVVALEARKRDTEDLVVEGRKVPAVKVQVSPPWPLSALWKGYYWFRKSDGLFLRYERANGPPGTEKTVVEMVRRVG